MSIGDSQPQPSIDKYEIRPADWMYLVRIAREAVGAVVTGGDPPEVAGYAWPDPTPRGAFVTLRHRGKLRGCIGTFHPTAPLPPTIREMAIAAVYDPRCIGRPIPIDELAELMIELSILSPPVRTSNPLTLEIGVHGIYIRAGGRTGCFLPQVAREAGWNAEQFLTRCCEMKLQLDGDIWCDPDTEVYLFTTQRFSDPPS